MNNAYSALVRIWELEDSIRVRSHRELLGIENLDDLKRIVKNFTDNGFVVELEGIAKNITA